MSSGIAAFQNESYHFYLGVRRAGEGGAIFLERAAGDRPATIAEQTLNAGDADRIELRIEADGRPYSFSYRLGESDWVTLADEIDGSILSTAVAKGFVGTYVGLHTRLE
jgi:alpha-N-arabinofuranosidase